MDPTMLPATLSDHDNPIIRTALEQALTQARTADSGSAQSMMAQWLLTLRHALPVTHYWNQSRELLFLVVDYLNVLGRIGDRVEWLEQGLMYSTAHGDDEAYALLQLQLGRERALQGDIPAATTLLHEGVSYFESRGIVYPPALIAQAFVANTLAQYDEAQELAKRALAVLPEDDWIERGHAYRNLGTAAHWKGQYEDALAYNQESLRLWRLAGNDRLIGFGLVNVGTTFRPLKRYDEAKAHYLEGIDIFEQVGDPVNRAFGQANLGNVYLMQQQWALAIEQYYLAEQVYTHNRFRALLGLLYNNWGMAFAGDKQYARAIRAYERSIALYEELENGYSCANSRDNLGLVYMQMGKYADAADAFSTALAELPESDTPAAIKLRREITEHLAEAERRMSPPDEASDVTG
jgi:tetratricopeptide (TPR) repeat protein